MLNSQHAQNTRNEASAMHFASEIACGWGVKLYSLTHFNRHKFQVLHVLALTEAWSAPKPAASIRAVTAR